MQAVGRFVGTVLAFAVAIAFMVILAATALAIPVTVVYAMYKAFPRKSIQPQAGEGWLDTIFANQYVIFSARVVLIGLALVLLFGAIYVSASIFYRIWRREFLHKVGWFEAAVAAKADRELEQVGEAYQEMLDEAWAQNEQLEKRFLETLQDLERVTDERDELAGVLGGADSPGSEGSTSET